MACMHLVFALLPVSTAEGADRQGAYGRLPNLLRPLECPEWFHFPLAHLLMGMCVTLLGVLITSCLLALFLKYLTQGKWELEPIISERPFLAVLLSIFGAAGLLESLLLGLLISQNASGWLNWRLPVPVHPLQCSVRLLNPPVYLPWHAGADLTAAQRADRDEFFVSLLLLMTLAAFLAGELLTYGGRACRAGLEYTSLPATTEFYLWEHLAFHLLCVSLAFLTELSDRMDIHFGICWEVYVCWTFVMLCSALLQATFAVLSMPFDSLVPHLGKPVIEGVLPVLGEPLDTFKDWIFVGLAANRGTCLSWIFAWLGMTILLVSNLHMRLHHLDELGRSLVPVRAACSESGQSFLARQTSPAKRAVALTEDLPQAILQSFFVLCFGGSAAQFAFIFISTAKLILCISLRTVVLERDGRHGDSWAATIEYYEMKTWILSLVLGSDHPSTLEAQFQLAFTLGYVREHEAAQKMCKTVVQARRSTLGALHPDTLSSQHELAWNLSHLPGRLAESLDSFKEVLEGRQHVLGGEHVDTLETKQVMASALRRSNRAEEALKMLKEVLEVRLRLLGMKHLATCWTQHMLGLTLSRLDQHAEALSSLQEAHATARELLGAEHPVTLDTEHAIACCRLALGRYQEALPAMEAVLEARRRVLGQDHVDTLGSEFYTALALEKVGRRQDALAMLLHVTEARRRTLGPNHPESLESELEMARLRSGKSDV